MRRTCVRRMPGTQQTGQGTGRLEEPITKVHEGARLAGTEVVFGECLVKKREVCAERERQG